jgi:hypothetical protein
MITREELVGLADSMAGAASQMGMTGYDTLIHSRKQLVEEVGELYKKLDLDTRIVKTE